MAQLTILCQLNKGCMGCCGHDFDSVERIKEAIKLNIQEFELVNGNDEQGLLGFRDRADAYDLRFGVCRNLIESDRKLFCPLHPALHQGKDLREGHCEIDHLCRTAREFGIKYILYKAKASSKIKPKLSKDFLHIFDFNELMK